MIKIEYEYINSPEFISEDNTKIKCIAKFRHLKKEHEFIAFAF